MLKSGIVHKNLTNNLLENYRGVLTSFHHVLSVYNFDAGAVYLPSPNNTNIFELVYSVGFPPEYFENVRTVVQGIGFGGTTVTLHSVRISEDTDNDPRFVRPVVFKSGFRSFISVPLLAEEDVIGLLNFGYRESMKFTLQQRETLSLLGNLIGLYFKDHLNLRVSIEQERQIKKMYVLGSELFRIHDLNRLCNIALEESMVLLNANCTFLILKPSNEVFAKGINKQDSLFTPELIGELEKEISNKPLIIERSSLKESALINFFNSCNLEKLYLLRLDLEDTAMAILAFGQECNQYKDFDTVSLTQIGNNLSVAMRKYFYNKDLQDYAVAKEYSRISCELHDSLAQQLSAIANKLEFIERQNNNGRVPSPVVEEIQECKDLVYLTIHDVRDAILGLRLLKPEEDDSFTDMVSKYLHSFAHRCPDIELITEIDQLGCQIPANIQIQLFRIIQESLTNIRKHSKARSASVSIKQYSNQVLIEIDDNGQGFDENKQYTGYGLSVMRERAEEIGANFKITSRQNQGTHIMISVEV
ncbi:MAG: GAF domain-containing sensor histidine kinase [Desulfotomaculaceae bacterium]|nr:GAF domain-containing sensor histidine kinase [Desulfotomaculaceae bacterium]